MSTVCSLCNLHCNILDIPVAWDSRHACSTCIPTIARAYMMHFFYVQQADPASKFFVFEAQGTRAVRRFKSLAEVAWSQSLKDLEWFNQNEVACMLHMYSTYMMHNWNIIQRCETRMSLFRPKFAVRRYMKFLFAGSSGQVSSVAEVKLPKTEVRVWAGKLHA